mgnify:CR=1 FL=1
MKSTHLSGKELLAWMVLIISILFFSATIAFAQDSKPQKRHINMVKVVDGKTIKVDTTFTATDEQAEKIMDDINKRFGEKDEETVVVKKGRKNDKRKEKEKVVVINVPHMSQQEHDKLKVDIDRAIDDMASSFSEMNKAFDNFDFNFNFNTDDDSVTINLDVPQIRIRKNKLMLPNDLPDSLLSEDKVIIEAGDGEEPPVFEKKVTGESGQEYFVYKRRNNEKDGRPALTMKVFPNPSGGKFSVSLNNASGGDVLVKVSSPSGKEVYRQLLESLKGEYQLDIDLGSKAKGTYLVTAVSGNNEVTRKIVIN